MNGASFNLPLADIPPIAILGIPFDNLPAVGIIDIADRIVASRRPGYVLCVKAALLLRAQEDVELRRILLDANLVLCEGKLLAWASRLLGNPISSPVMGNDLDPLLFQMATDKGFRVFLLGTTKAVVGRFAASALKQQPKLVIAGQYAPPLDSTLEMAQDEIARHIHEARPDLLFVSLVGLEQEKWIAMHYRALKVPLVIGLGEARSSRVPDSLGGKCSFVWAILSQWWHMCFRSRRARRRPPAMTHMEEDCQHVTLPQRLDYAAASESSVGNDVLVGEKNCLVELANVKFMDSTGVGFLIRLQKRVHAAGRQLILIAPSVEVDRVLGLMHLREYFACAANTAAAKKLINARASERDFIVSPTANPGMLSWRGEITAANSEQVWEETRAYLSALHEEQPQLMIDLREVRFLDSTGVGLMVRAKKLAQRQAVRLQFINPSAAALNILKISQLEEFLTSN